jgi:hypothetical protein
MFALFYIDDFVSEYRGQPKGKRMIFFSNFFSLFGPALTVLLARISTETIFTEACNIHDKNNHSNFSDQLFKPND